MKPSDDKPQSLFVRLANLCQGVVPATTYPFPGAEEYTLRSSVATNDGETPRTDEFQRIRDNTPGVDAEHDYAEALEHARQLERECDDLDRVGQTLARELSTMTRDRDARAREACSAEERTGCSFARSATAANEFMVAGFFKKDMGRWIEVSDRQADEDGVEFLYMVRDGYVPPERKS